MPANSNKKPPHLVYAGLFLVLCLGSVYLNRSKLVTFGLGLQVLAQLYMAGKRPSRPGPAP